VVNVSTGMIINLKWFEIIILVRKKRIDMDRRIDIKLLEFLEPQKGMPQELAINQFVLSNFDKPDVLPTKEKDDACILLSELYKEKLIDLIKGAAPLYMGKYNSEKVILWWDNMPGKDYYKITRSGINFLDQYRISQTASETNKSVKSTNRNTIIILTFALLISAANLWVTTKNYLSENEKDDLQIALHTKMIIADSLQSLVNQQQNTMTHFLLYKLNSKNKGHKQ